ncbi:MAG: hypothetical protein ABSH19_07490 [Opitutales bacterium]|jgi:hypothetical protein
MAAIRREIPETSEHYGPQKTAGRRFDREYWQAQGDEAIFEAAKGMVMDYLAVKHGHVDEPRLQRSVESFRRA